MNLATITKDTLGGLILQLQAMVARINTIWGKEHGDDGKHKIPSFTDIDQISASMFVGTASQTFTVAVANVNTLMLSKSLAGDLVTLVFELSGTVGGTPATFVSFLLPYGLIAKRLARNMIFLTDNAVRVDGFAVVSADGDRVNFFRADVANYTGGTTAVRGQLIFQVKTARVA